MRRDTHTHLIEYNNAILGQFWHHTIVNTRKSQIDAHLTDVTNANLTNKIQSYQHENEHIANLHNNNLLSIKGTHTITPPQNDRQEFIRQVAHYDFNHPLSVKILLE